VWNAWETYLNIGTVTKPILEPLSNFEGLEELIEQDKLRSKERDIIVHGIYPKNKLKIHQYNGRNFHCYPQTEKCKNSETAHNIYRILALYLKFHDAIVYCTFFAKGEELGALYEDNGILRMAGLYADKDLKPVSVITKFPITKGFQKLAYETFDQIRKEETPTLVLEWRDYVQSALQEKSAGVCKQKIRKVQDPMELDKNLNDLFKKVLRKS